MSTGYLGLFLDTEGVEDLWPHLTGIPLLENAHAHHMTLKFNPTNIEIDAFPFGVRVVLAIAAYVYNDNVQTFIVQEVPGFRCDNEVPHITIATSATGKPVQSNDLLKEKKATVLSTHLLLPAVAGYSHRGQLRTRR